jgi:hypothetical protein
VRAVFLTPETAPKILRLTLPIIGLVGQFTEKACLGLKVMVNLSSRGLEPVKNFLGFQCPSLTSEHRFSPTICKEKLHA